MSDGETTAFSAASRPPMMAEAMLPPPMNVTFMGRGWLVSRSSFLVAAYVNQKRETRDESLLSLAEDGRTHPHQGRTLEYRRLEVIRHAHGQRVEHDTASDQPLFQLAQLRELPPLLPGVR